MQTGRSNLAAALLVLALVNTGCGDNEPPQGEVRSGDRIRAMYFVDDAGTRIPRGWFDRQLGVECTWMGGEEPMCLPAYLGTNFFADAACTEPIAEVRPPLACDSAPAAYVAVWRDPCDENIADEVRTITDEPVPGPLVYQYSSWTGTCNPFPNDGAVTYRRTGTRLGPAQLVHGRVVNAGHGRIRTRTILGGDGTRVPSGAFDAELDVACWLDEDLGCLPSATHSGYAEDDACARPVARALLACGPPRYTATYAGGQLALYEGSELITSDPADELAVYSTYAPGDEPSAVCDPTTISAWEGTGLYRAGSPVDLDRLVPVERQVGLGGPTVPAWRVTGAHRELIGHHLAGTDLECHPEQIAPGLWRCLPYLSRVSRGVTYADDACTQPIAVAVGFDPAVDHLPAIERRSDGACGETLHPFALGAERPAGSTFRRGPDDTCVVLEQVVMGFDFRVFDVGAEATLAMFPTLTPIVE